MKLLDRFRSQPEWRSEDPAVRATSVRALSNSEEEQELLNEIARHDDDPSVRLEAVVRLGDIDVLASIASDDVDTTVRGEAKSVLRDLAIEAEDLGSIEHGLAVVSNERDLVAVARSARLESVSLVALGRLKDPRAIGSVARRATHGEIAKEALSRLDDPNEIMAVALKSEDKAIAVGAFERLTAGHLTRDVLEQLSKQAKQKAVQRRAKAALGVLEEALPGTADLGHAAVHNELEAMAVETNLERGLEKLDRLEAEWSALDATTDAALSQRFASARHQAEIRLAELESAQMAEQQIEEEENLAVAKRDALCRRVESLSGIVPSETVQQFREEWAALAGDAAAGPDGATEVASIADQLSVLDRRFERALGAVDERERQLQASQSRLAKVGRIIAEMEVLAAASASSSERWSELDSALEGQLGHKADRSWQWLTSPGAGSDQTDAVDALRRRFNVIRTTRQSLSAEARAKKDRLEREHMAQVLHRARTVEGLVASDKLRLVEAERQLRGIRRLMDDPGPIPRRELESVTRKLRRAHTGLLGRTRELRDFADWQRWANLGIQEELCRRMEELAQTPDDDEAGLTARFQEIMVKWRQASDVPRDRGAELWERFKTAHDTIHPHCQKFLDAQKRRREQNFERQRAIVEESERLAMSTDWLKTLRRMTGLQAEWKDLKSVPRTEQKELWKRFRDACNTFFGRRKADLAERKQEWAKNLALKEALCDRVIALAEVKDLDAAVGEAKRAQAEWKTIGPVRRNRSEVVWQRFHTECDAVFERVQTKQRADSQAQAAIREALCVEAELLMPGEPSAVSTEDLAARIRDLQQRWREAPEVPQTLSRQLTARFGQVIARLVETYPDAFRGTNLDPARKLKRLENLCERVEALLPIEALGQEGASPAEILATKWRDALASNLMGARVDEAAERRSALEEVKQARADCRRLGDIAGDDGRQLLKRFHSACDRVQG